MQVGLSQRSFAALIGRLVGVIVICASTSVVMLGQERNVVVGCGNHEVFNSSHQERRSVGEPGNA